MSLADDGEASPLRSTAVDEAAKTVAQVGRRLRDLRQKRHMTLQALADIAELSPSMLSLVERGLTSPSLASLAALAHALGTNLPDLIVGKHVPEDEIVTRFEEQPLLETADHVLRRVLKDDLRRGVKITFNEYGPNIGNSPTGISHSGFEYGFCLEGELTIEVEGVSHVLRGGDLLTLESQRLHKIWNYSRRPARAVWFNIEAKH